MTGLGWQAWLTLGVVASMVVALLKEAIRPDLIFLSGLGGLLLAGVISPEEAFAGFANPAVLTVGALFVVAAGVQQTRALGFMDRLLFARRPGPWVLPRLMLPINSRSTFSLMVRTRASRRP